MKKIFNIVLILLIIYIVLQLITGYVIGNKMSSYKITVDNTAYNIKEVYTIRHRSFDNTLDKSTYYYEISESKSGITINYKLNNNHDNLIKLITDLRIYKDKNILCIFPILKDKNEAIDLVCNIENVNYLYGSIKGKYISIDSFVSELIAEENIHPSWVESSNKTKQIDSISIYSSNIPSDLKLSIWNRTGFYWVSNSDEKRYPIEYATYSPSKLTTMVNQYYVIPDSSDNNNFSRVYITNLISGRMEAVDLGLSLSYNSFIQGVVNKLLYIVDKDKKIQYTVDIYNKKTVITGSVVDKTDFYYNGEWMKKTIEEVISNEMYFGKKLNLPDNLINSNYDYSLNIGGETDGYYYLFLKKNSNIYAYIVDKQNINMSTLIFIVPSIKNITNYDNDLYFISEDTLYMYRKELGLVKLIKSVTLAESNERLYNAYLEK